MSGTNIVSLGKNLMIFQKQRIKPTKRIGKVMVIFWELAPLLHLRENIDHLRTLENLCVLWELKQKLNGIIGARRIKDLMIYHFL